MKKKILRKDKGITLIALVVTIIVLLILAGISLSLIVGGNGIINKATHAADTTEHGQRAEEIQLKLSEILMDYYADTKRTANTLEGYIKQKCKENEGILVVGDGVFSYNEKDDTLTYTHADGYKSIISIDKDGNVKIEGSSSSGGIITDENFPNISFTTTTNSISFVAKDMLVGVAAWAYTETADEPTLWNEVNPTQKVFSHTISNLTNLTTYYIWIKDANGNITNPPQNVKTLDFDPIKVSWNMTESGEAIIAVDNYISGLTYTYSTDDGSTWTTYSDTNRPVVSSGTRLYFKVSDGSNEKSSQLINVLKESTVTYDANGGTGSVPASLTKVAHGTNITVDTSVILSKDGCTFLGWALTPDATEGISNFEMPGNDVILYAVWGGGTMQSATEVIKSSNYGEVVDYTANGVSDWKIFYNDGTNIFLITSDYLPTEKIPAKAAEYVPYGNSKYTVQLKACGFFRHYVPNGKSFLYNAVELDGFTRHRVLFDINED